MPKTPRETGKPNEHPSFTPPPLTAFNVVAFDLEATLHSGQVFHWQKQGTGWLGLIDETPVYVEQPNLSTIQAAPEHHALLRHYFSLDRDVDTLWKTFPSHDTSLEKAIAYAGGIRIIRQPTWECLATFITSSLKQIPHIRSMSLALRANHGKAIKWNGATLWQYPTALSIAEAGETKLRKLGLGYRASSLWQSAQAWFPNPLTPQVATEWNDETLELSLRQFRGVGPKIAHCVMLFAYGRDAAFPIDTWISRILRECYFPKKRKPPSDKDLAIWAKKHFGPFRGWAQQYLFHWARTQKQQETPKPWQSI